MTDRVQGITILGSTGSIGANTLDVLSRHRDRYRVFALTAASRVEPLFEQCLAWVPRFAVMTDPVAAGVLEGRLRAQGCSTRVPGLAFVGLHRMWAGGSGTVLGVGADAIHVAESVAGHVAGLPGSWPG